MRTGTSPAGPGTTRSATPATSSGAMPESATAAAYASRASATLISLRGGSPDSSSFVSHTSACVSSAMTNPAFDLDRSGRKSPPGPRCPGCRWPPSPARPESEACRRLTFHSPLAQREALVPSGGRFLANAAVLRETAAPRQERALLSIDVRPGPPRGRLRDQRGIRDLLVKLDELVLRLLQRLDGAIAVRAQVLEAVHDPFALLLDQCGRVGQDRRVVGAAVEHEHVGEAVDHEPEVVPRPVGPLLAEVEAVAAANVHRKERTGERVEARGDEDHVDLVIALARADAPRGDLLDRPPLHVDHGQVVSVERGVVAMLQGR